MKEKYNETINKLQKEIKNREAKLEKYINIISHDFKSPIITIKGFIDLIEKDIKNNLSDNLDNYIRYIKDSTDKLISQLNGLQKLSRIKKISGKTQKISLNKLLDKVINTLTILEKVNGLKIEIEENLPVIWGNEDLIIELFHLLIDNAVKFSAGDKNNSIRIGSEEKNGEKSIFVRDNGIGIEQKNLEKIFNIFEKIENKNSDAGIGLTIAKEIIDSHNGTIWAESGGLGKGSTFYFSIPDPVQK